MTATIAQYTRQPKRTAELDGLNDVLTGVVFLVLTTMEYTSVRLQATIHGHNFWETPAFKAALIVNVLAMVGMFPLIFGVKRIVENLRQRFVYPRLGYSAPRVGPLRRKKLISLAVSLSIGALIGIAALNGHLLLTWPLGMTVLILGVIFSTGYLFQFAQLGFLRHLIVAGVAIAASAILYMCHLNWEPACGLFVVLISINLIVTGAIPFARLIKTPIMEEGDVE